MRQALDQLVVVLVRPEGPINVGSVARLCGNFGCVLRLVEPLTIVSSGDAMKMAHPCQELLASAPVFTSLVDALADVTLAVATSSKLRLGVEAPALSMVGARQLLPPAGEKLALVFGNERTGLSTLESSVCPRVMRLPTPGPVESLNLSHAVAVTLTLFAEAYSDDAHREFRATKATRLALLTKVLDVLEEKAAFKGQPRRRDALAKRLHEVAHKMDVSEYDVALLDELLEAGRSVAD